MPVKQITPYIHFDGQAEDAIRLYEQALGAKTEGLVRYGDVPGACEGKDYAKRVMHAYLRIGEAGLMLNDAPPLVSARSNGGNAADRIAIAIDLDDVRDMLEKIDALAVGGKVDVPPHDMFDGGKLAVVTDAYGVRWTFHCKQASKEV